MHVKLTTSGGRRYVQLVESYRDEAGRVKKRTVATLGRAEQVDVSWSSFFGHKDKDMLFL